METLGQNRVVSSIDMIVFYGVQCFYLFIYVSYIYILCFFSKHNKVGIANLAPRLFKSY